MTEILHEQNETIENKIKLKKYLHQSNNFIEI